MGNNEEPETNHFHSLIPRQRGTEIATAAESRFAMT